MTNHQKIFYFSKTDLEQYTTAQELFLNALKFDWIHRGSVMVTGENYTLRMAKFDYAKRGIKQ